MERMSRNAAISFMRSTGMSMEQVCEVIEAIERPLIENSKHTSLKKSYKRTYVSDGEAIKGANDTLRNLGMNYWE